MGGNGAAPGITSPSPSLITFAPAASPPPPSSSSPPSPADPLFTLRTSFAVRISGVLLPPSFPSSPSLSLSSPSGSLAFYVLVYKWRKFPLHLPRPISSPILSLFSLLSLLHSFRILAAACWQRGRRQAQDWLPPPSSAPAVRTNARWSIQCSLVLKSPLVLPHAHASLAPLLPCYRFSLSFSWIRTTIRRRRGAAFPDRV